MPKTRGILEMDAAERQALLMATTAGVKPRKKKRSKRKARAAVPSVTHGSHASADSNVSPIGDKPAEPPKVTTLEEAKAAFLALAAELKASLSHRKLETLYADVHAHGHKGGPYPWQVEFHHAGAGSRQRAIIAANRSGKTRSAAAEVAMHLTGRYPAWWQGKRFTHPIEVWVCGNTNQDVRDIQQNELLGKVEEGRRPSGEGWIPLEAIGGCSFRQCGVTNVVDTVQVKHVSGGVSTLGFKSFEQKAIAFQGTAKHLIWMDEEPENDPNNEIFSECLMRLMTVDGIMLFTRTPLFGRTAIVEHFLKGGQGVWYINVGWDQAPHLTEAQRAEFLASVPEHQRETRSKGVPMMGSGAVYPVGDEEIACDPMPIPDHWRRICGIDFGIDHPAAAVWIAHDADADTIYVTDCYKKSGETAVYHADAINARGKWIPVAWPHDGMIRDKAGGVALKDQYLAKGVNMLGFSARYDDEKGGGQSREPITIEILERMRTGRFKVFRHLEEWFAEKRMLHRKDGKIVPVNDDIESATRYAVMMRRCAVTLSDVGTPRPARYDDGQYDPLAEFSGRMQR